MNREMARGQTLEFEIEKNVRKFLLQEVILCETMGMENVYA